MTPPRAIVDRTHWKYPENQYTGHGSMTVLEIALAGSHGEYCNLPDANCRSLGWSGGSCYPERYFSELVEGGLFIDKRTVDEELIFRLVVGGPMLDADLPDRSIRRLDLSVRPFSPVTTTDRHGSEWLHIIAEHAQETFKHCPRSLDYISLDLHAELWEAAGARVGVRRGDRIEYRDGTTEEITEHTKTTA